MSEKQKKEPTVSVKVRMPQSLLDRCESLRESGPNLHKYQSEFLGYLIMLGSIRYANEVLPAEMGDRVATGA